MVFKHGQMEQDMKGTGKITRLMERVSFGMSMGMFLKESGRMIRRTAMGYTLTLTAASTKASGIRINSMGLE